MNKGLTVDFKIENGKFGMKSGKDKVDANVLMLRSFFGWFRIFLQDYCVNSYWLWLRTNNFVLKHQDILKLDVSRVIDKYLSYTALLRVYIGKTKQTDKKLNLSVIYGYKLEEVKDVNITQFTQTNE